MQDRMRRRAIERLLTIVGEAAKQLSPDTRAAIDQPWTEIIRFRDRSIHGYDSVVPEVLYEIATKALPALRQAVAHHRSEGG